MKVYKRNGAEQDFCLDKIINAIKKANNAVSDDGKLTDEQFDKVVATVEKFLEPFDTVKVEDIQDLVEKALMKHNRYEIAKAYILFRDKKQNQKLYDDVDEQVLAITKGESAELRGDNANKHIDVNSSIRDYIAGTECKSLAQKMLDKSIITAHKKGWLHYHDMDYSPVMPLHNCFSGNTKVVTEYGTLPFSSFKEGETITVLDYKGVRRKAIVHLFEKQPFNIVTLVARGKNRKVEIECTADHRWMLEDGSITTSLKVGDRIKRFERHRNTITNEEQAKYWCFGFIVGDGCDHYNLSHVRLCGYKNQYLENFKKAGCFYNLTPDFGKDACPVTSHFRKQDFLNSKGWKFLNAEQKAFLFEGLMAADHWGENSITTSDERELNLIKECAPIAGYVISSIKEVTRNTNYKENALQYEIRFISTMKENYGYVVKCIKPKYKDNRPQQTYCVEEPETHTFTLEKGVVTGNCDVFNIEDMLDNGFMMNDTKITRPRRFSTAANLAAQVNLIISGSQYGGQTFSWAPLAKYVESTRVDCKIELLTILSVLPKWLALILKPWYNKMVEVMVKRDVHVGIKTYQYQVLCHQSSNGQTPFVSNVINLREAMGEREQKDLAFIIEEILKRRTKGVLDKLGKPMPPLFPKLLYYTCDGLNVKKGDPYFYLTELAAKCITVRMQPDIISEKKNREVKKGQMIPAMGCRSFLAPVWEERRYPRNTMFYWQYVTSNNIQYEGAPGRNIDFNRKIEYSVLPHSDANCEIAINFRGNTGWLKETTDEEVVILQPIVYGRFNMGVVTINLPHCALSAVKSVKDNNMDSKYLKDEFYRILDERLEICHKALLTRWESVKNIKAKNSPILWQHGALARLNEDDTIGDWVVKHEPAFTSISLGYVGLYETCMALTGESNTSSKGQKTSSKILQYLNKKCEEWKEEDHLGYSIYGTPEEALTYKFASALAKDFGLIEHITDKEYVVNSYHVDPREDIDAFLKLKIEGQYLALSSGGAVSYIETPDMQKNPEAIISVIQYMHEHIMYAEVNTKLDTCYNCGYQGELKMIKTENGDFRFVCPVCGCDDPDKQLVTRRICGYMGVVNAGNVNKGRGDDIFNRTLHLDSESNIRYVGNMKPTPKSCLCS